MEIKQPLTVPEMAALLRVNKDYVYDQCALVSNSWPHIRVGRQIRFTAEDVEAVFALLRRKSQRSGTVAALAGRAPRHRQRRSAA